MKASKYEVLMQLFGCYLHQDWTDEFDSDIAALQAARDCEPQEHIMAGVAELDSLLARAFSEEELRAILEGENGCCFSPCSRGLSWKDWLGRARGVLLGTV